ncbi:anti-sigma factor [Kutzneria albida]|uniref:anti-sigma factor n=1 Tax=Kutzneria albida TaxID=43357 RepID=UPI0011DDC850|nr:anti-sigma factor [Kutzneria albida]
MSENGHCPNEQLAVGWALHALEPDEENAARLHLPTCPVCQETVRSTEQLGALLGSAVPQEEPPAGLRDRVMQLAERTPQAAFEAFPFPADAVLDTQPPGVADLDSRRPRPLGRGLLAAAAVLVLVLGGVAGVLGYQLNQVSQQQQAQAQVLGVVTDPSMRRAVLSGGSGQQVAVLLSSDKGAAVVPSGLAPNAADTSYVVWGLSAPTGKPVALSRFDVASGGSGPETIDWSAAAAAHKGFAISLEPGKSLPDKPTQVLGSGQAGN